MNERMLELARQAGLKKPHASDTEYLGNFDWREFGDLIVRECMGVARGMRNPPNLNYKPSDRFVDELRLHFGVEE